MSWWLGIWSYEENVSVANNTSDIIVCLDIGWNGGSWAADNPGWSMNIDGAGYSGTANFNTGRASSGTERVATIRRTITHNSDGTRSVGYSGGYAGTGSGWQSTSGSRTLTTIPRVSDISVSSSSVVAGGSQTVTATKKSSSFTDTITVSCGSYSMNVSSGTAFTIPETWMNAFPSATSATCTATVTTKSGSTTIGSKSVTFTLTASNYTLPVTRNLTPSSTPAAFGSRYVQLLSKVSASISASGYQGSTISSIITTIEGLQYSGASITSEFLTTSGDISVSTVVTDSRGKTRTISGTVTVISYHAPSVAASVIAVASSSKAVVSFSGEVSSVESLNDKKYTVTWTNNDSESGTLASQVTLSDYEYDISLEHTGIDTSLTYTYTIKVTDSVGTTEVIVVTGKPVISRLAGGTGVTFGAEASVSGIVASDGWDIKIEDASLQSALVAVFGSSIVV